ncbi:MerR family transcriptional regulator [Nocardiopsis gilva]|uniref:MerR family transcriptional regulator n=1 Tax=Nocardiopsis gilva TaxID=280236 RepID=UPI0003611F55|nr:MerR family transcriptional regulator [Nocardiopsis gilva]
MHRSFTPPRQVKIGDAAAFAGTTPRAIRHYHEIGLMPEPERGADGRRRYGYGIRLLWIRKMADVGISLDDMRAAYDEAGSIEETLDRLDEALAAQEAVIQRQRAAARRLREAGSPLGLLSAVVTDRFRDLPPGAVRQSDLDALLVTERLFGSLGAVVQASSVIVLATHPELRAAEDRLDAAEAALDDTVDPDDPRVEELAEQRCAHMKAVEQAIEAAGLDEVEEKLYELDEAAPKEDEGQMTALEGIGKMPSDFSPARTRCMELAAERYGRSLSGDD